MNWDKYYLDICEVIKTNSKCLSRQIGCIMVREHNIISTGYNGPARGIPPCSERYKINVDNNFRGMLIDKGIDPDDESNHNICPRQTLGFESGEGLGLCVAAHSERNCILNAARHGICTKETTLYMTCNIPCSNCLTEIINAGVIEIVCTDISFYDEMSKYLINNSDLVVRKFRLTNIWDDWIENGK